MVLRGGGFSARGVGRPDLDLYLAWRQQRTFYLNREADFLCLVLPDLAVELAIRTRFGAGNMEFRAVQALYVQREGPFGTLVEDAHGVIVADTTIRQQHEKRVAVVEHVDVHGASGCQRIQHQASDGCD